MLKASNNVRKLCKILCHCQLINGYLHYHRKQEVLKCCASRNINRMLFQSKSFLVIRNKAFANIQKMHSMKLRLITFKFSILPANGLPTYHTCAIWLSVSRRQLSITNDKSRKMCKLAANWRKMFSVLICCIKESDNEGIKYCSTLLNISLNSVNLKSQLSSNSNAIKF